MVNLAPRKTVAAYSRYPRKLEEAKKMTSLIVIAAVAVIGWFVHDGQAVLERHTAASHFND
jgi:hypothetical protein